MCNTCDPPYIFNSSHQHVEEFCEAVRIYALGVKQLSRGAFGGRSTIIVLPDCTLMRRKAAASHAACCWIPQDATFMFPLDTREAYVRGRLCGPEHQAGSHGNHEVHAILPENFERLMITVRIDSLPEYLDREECGRFLEVLATIENGRVDAQLKCRTTARLLAIFRSIEQSATTLTPAMLKECSRTIINELYDYLASHARFAPVRASNREKILQRALDLFMSQPTRAFTLDEMAREIFASKRALQYAFSSILSMSPMRFQKLYRLNLIRTDLRNAQSPLTFVSIFSKYAFSNPGRMSQEYASLFGERPRDTLQQALIDVAPEQVDFTTPAFPYRRNSSAN